MQQYVLNGEQGIERVNNLILFSLFLFSITFQCGHSAILSPFQGTRQMRIKCLAQGNNCHRGTWTLDPTVWTSTVSYPLSHDVPQTLNPTNQHVCTFLFAGQFTNENLFRKGSSNKKRARKKLPIRSTTSLENNIPGRGPELEVPGVAPRMQQPVLSTSCLRKKLGLSASNRSQISQDTKDVCGDKGWQETTKSTKYAKFSLDALFQCFCFSGQYKFFSLLFWHPLSFKIMSHLG